MSELKARIGHFVAPKQTTVVECLNSHFHLNQARIDELLALGAVYLNKRRVGENCRLEKGAYLRIHLQPKLFPVAGVDWDRVIVKEEREFLVVNKPPGIPVHPTLDNLRDNVLHQLRVRTRQTLLVTQRIDQPTSGLIVLARTCEFQKRFNQWLFERKVKKSYRALSEARPPHGSHVHFMEPSKKCPKKLGTAALPGWQRCEMTIHMISDLDMDGPPYKAFDMEIELHTGRTHQIRAQLYFLGAPILGDRLYGSRFSNRFPNGDRHEGIGLFSAKISWPNMGGPGWEFEAEVPWKR